MASKSWAEIQSSVQRGTSPEQNAGTFVDDVLDMLESHQNDPTMIAKVIKDGRAAKQNIVSALVRGIGQK